uniref:Uncharacterized protein n=1 Tax=Anguilla anguilla TaxID=7936 RepID=A0A0E9Q8G9_ANGAN
MIALQVCAPVISFDLNKYSTCVAPPSRGELACMMGRYMGRAVCHV